MFAISIVIQAVCFIFSTLLFCCCACLQVRSLVHLWQLPVPSDCGAM